MKIAIASFTRNGCVWNQKLCAALKKHSCEGYALEKYGKEAGIPAIAPSLPAWTERMFQKMDAILFIGACGIAVRSIAIAGMGFGRPASPRAWSGFALRALPAPGFGLWLLRRLHRSLCYLLFVHRFLHQHLRFIVALRQHRSIPA